MNSTDDEKDSYDIASKQASLLIEDAYNYRSILHKLDERSMRIYEILHSRWFTSLFWASLFGLMFLPFIEYPNSITISSDVRVVKHRFEIPCGVTESIELVFLSVILIESVFQTLVILPDRLWKSPWLLGRYLLFVITGIDFIVSLSLRCNEFYRIRRFCRPYFFISSSQMMKKLINCLHYTLPKLFSTLFLLFLWLFGATLVALCIFPDHIDGEATSFSEVYISFYNLLVLLTTANHPDVLIKFYNKNRATALFAITFLSIGLYVFMNILTAIVYSEFRGYLRFSMQKRLDRRRLATRAAFELLKTNDSLDGSGRVSRGKILHLMDSVRFSKWIKSMMFSVYETRFFEADLDAIEFMELFRTLDLTCPSDKEPKMRHVTSAWARFLQQFLMSSAFSTLSIGVSVLNVIYLTIDLSSRVTALKNVNVQMRVINWCFVTFYLLEQSCHLWCVGARRFFSSIPSVLSFFTVILLLVVKLLELGFLIAELRGHSVFFFDFSLWDLVRFANLLLLARAIRVVHLFTWTRLVAGVVFELPRNLSPVLGILASAYYIYALLGMNLFRGAITSPYNANGTLQDFNISFECGTYQQLEYWTINFDDFASSLVLLWDLMVVNNWFVIVDAYTRAVNTRWIHVYMISWWLVAVVGLLSLVTAYIIEAFLYRRDLYGKAVQTVKQPFEVVRIGGAYTILRRESLQPGANAQIRPSLSDQGCTLSSSRNLRVPSDSGCPEQSSYESQLISVHPYVGNQERPLALVNPTTSDEIFRSVLCEPSEEKLVSEIRKHPFFCKPESLPRIDIISHDAEFQVNNVIYPND